SVVLTNTSNVTLLGIALSISFPADLELTQFRDINNPISIPATSDTNVTFTIGNMDIGARAPFSIKLKPTRAGSFSIRFSALGQGSDAQSQTFTLRAGNGQADLGVALSAT